LPNLTVDIDEFVRFLKPIVEEGLPVEARFQRYTL
jgi:hypothetical protein